LGDEPIKEKTQIYKPHWLIVVDPAMRDAPHVYSGLRPAGLLVLNSTVLPEGKPSENLETIALVDATSIGP